MFKHTKRILTSATILSAAIGPPVAFARPAEDPPLTSAPSSQAPIVPSAHTTTISSDGFDWADAGIGAGGVLALVSVGSGTLVLRRRSPAM